MGNLQQDLDSALYLSVVFLGALLGSAKAITEFDRDKSCLPRSIDLLLGIFCGVALAHHFGNGQSLALSGVLALLGGVSGAMVIEVFMQMLPNIVKKAIQSWSDKIK